MGIFSKDEKIELEVTGMTCGHCESRVSNALLTIEGVKKAVADHEANKAVVTVKQGKADRAALIDAIKEAGYEAA